MLQLITVDLSVSNQAAVGVDRPNWAGWNPINRNVHSGVVRVISLPGMGHLEPKKEQ